MEMLQVHISFKWLWPILLLLLWALTISSQENLRLSVMKVIWHVSQPLQSLSSPRVPPDLPMGFFVVFFLPFFYSFYSMVNINGQYLDVFPYDISIGNVKVRHAVLHYGTWAPCLEARSLFTFSPFSPTVAMTFNCGCVWLKRGKIEEERKKWRSWKKKRRDPIGRN